MTPRPSLICKQRILSGSPYMLKTSVSQAAAPTPWGAAYSYLVFSIRHDDHAVALVDRLAGYLWRNET